MYIPFDLIINTLFFKNPFSRIFSSKSNLNKFKFKGCKIRVFFNFMLSKTCFKLRRYPLDLRSCVRKCFSEQSSPDPKIPETAEPNRRTIYDLNVAQDYIKSNIRYQSHLSFK